jgi:Second Messenger Oligonucleotide or Dinucleotide Synthetase domain
VATLPTCFRQTLSDIQPAEDEKNAAEAHEQVSDALKADRKLRELGIDPVLIGSYAREVSIKRVKDVDVFGRLTKADDTLDPGDALNQFERVLIARFGKERVQRQHRSLKTNLPDYDLCVDSVPARPRGNHWEIPNRPKERTRWVETNPTKLNELTTQVNKAFTLNGNGIYVPTVKLIRQTRRTWLGDQPGGFFFEILTYWVFVNDQPKATSVAGYLTFTLEKIADTLPQIAIDGLDDPTLPDKKISTKATAADFQTATTQIAEAATLARVALDEPDDCKAAVRWRDLLGKTSEGDDVFPLPEYCNTDGTHKRYRAVTKGATRVPAGNDRYA